LQLHLICDVSAITSGIRQTLPQIIFGLAEGRNAVIGQLAEKD